MNDRRGSSDEGLWLVLCVLVLLLMVGAGGFLWFRQRGVAQAMQARQAAEMNLVKAELALQQAEEARIQAEVAHADAARVQTEAPGQTAAGRPLVPEMYLNQDLWQHVESFADAPPDAKVFTVDPDSGEILFGDGEHGAAPPEGPATIQATYETAGGGTVTVSLPETDLRETRVRALQSAEGVLKLEVVDPAN